MRQLLIANARDVHSLLTPPVAIGLMRGAFEALATGEVHNPLRSLMRVPDPRGFLGLMPCWRGGERPYFALKEVCVFPGNPARGLDSHLGSVLLHDGETGELLAVVNAAAVTAVRTAAVTALATSLLAREGSRTLGVLGAGVQAREHLRTMPEVMRVERVFLHSRSIERAEELADWAARELGLSVTVVEHGRAAVEAADVLVTVTSSREPVVRREWVNAGTHLNLVGSSVRTAREADSATIAAGSFFVDRHESAVNESGDYLKALEEGAIGEGHIQAELGDLVMGRVTGRATDEEITIFKSLGLAIEDLVSAAHIYERARETGEGTWVGFDS